MWVAVYGLDELVKEAESLASEQQIAKTNNKILKVAAQKTQSVLKPNVHRSENVNASGLKGKKTGVHAADAIEIKRPKKRNGHEYIEIGWDYKGTHGYMQWEEWGNTTRRPHPVLYPTIESCQGMYHKITLDAYQDLIKKLK